MTRSRRNIIWKGFVLLSALAGISSADGFEPAKSKTVAIRSAGKSPCGQWDVIESPSFRFLHHGMDAFARELATHSEQVRENLQTRWFGQTSHALWRPACEVYLCSTPAEFIRISGAPAETFGISNLEIGEGTVWRRQVIVRADVLTEVKRVFCHELTHVVMADRFPTKQIPRWADEGIAVLSEPASRLPLLSSMMNDAQIKGELLKLRTLISAKYYPRSERSISLFYGQSALVVKALVERKDATTFLKFVEDAQELGADAALRSNYGIAGLEELETNLLTQMKTPGKTVWDSQASSVAQQEPGGPSLN